MNSFSFNQPLTAEDISFAKKSVTFLNEALARRFDLSRNMKLIAWISDVHLHAETEYDRLGPMYSRYVDTRRQFLLAMHEVHALEPAPEVIVLGGDLTDRAKGEELLTFAGLLMKGDWTIPTLPVFGNHDNVRSPIKEEIRNAWSFAQHLRWPEITDNDAYYYSVEIAGVKMIVLDSQTAVYELSERQKSFLMTELAKTSLPVIIISHRHQLPVGNWVDGGVMKGDGLLFRDKEVWNTIDQSPHVLGVFSGHVHYPRLWQYRNKLYGTFPAVAYGIGANTGWGGILLQDNRIEAVFCKDLHGEGYDMYEGSRYQKGSFRFMERELFQNHRLCYPGYWPWEFDPKLRN